MSQDITLDQEREVEKTPVVQGEGKGKKNACWVSVRLLVPHTLSISVTGEKKTIERDLKHCLKIGQMKRV